MSFAEQDSKKRAAVRSDEKLDVIVVGAGFAGLYLLYRLRDLGFSTRVFEAGAGVGGTWYWNRYPGARCDIESMEYSYQFSEELQQEWDWTERYSTQTEILRYIEHVAERFDLLRDIQFNSRVVAAIFDESSSRWRVEFTDGAFASARYLVMATGCLSARNTPDFEGLDGFSGSLYHTAEWPHEGVDFTGRRVSIIGTGSSAVQSIPIIAEQAEQLYVFQRTPNYSIPAHNGPLDPEVVRQIKSDYSEFRERGRMSPFGIVNPFPPNEDEDPERIPTEEEVRAALEQRWQYGGISFLNVSPYMVAIPELNEVAAEFIRSKIRAKVNDPDVAELLSPRTLVGCKRLCIDTGYYETFNRPNVKLVDISSTPIDRIEPEGVAVQGQVYECDDLVLATGFDAMTGALLNVDIRGRDGQTLGNKWASGPRTYLGLATAGFPNLFIVTGPGSPSVLSNMVQSIEQHVEWISSCVAYMEEKGFDRIEATHEAEDAWVDHVNEVASMTVFPSCNSWYVGANIPGKPRVFMPYLGFPPYVEICNQAASSGYEGFQLT